MDYTKKLSNFFDSEIIQIFIETIHKYYHNKRKTKYSVEYYLYYIILVLKELQSWKSLKYLLTNNKTNHYKTIQDIHLEWSRLNIYKITYNIILQKYKLNNLKASSNLTLFIDSSNIYNKNGCMNTGYGMNPKKKESRISVICDKDKNVFSLTLIKVKEKTVNQKTVNQKTVNQNTVNQKTVNQNTVNQKTVNQKTVNQKTIIRNTFPNDSKTLKPSIHDLLKNKLKYKKLFLVGDKGYALKKTDKNKLFIDYNIELVYPHRKNQKEKTPKKHKVLLRKRYVVENVFSKLKQFNRICVRKDKLDTTYLGFCFLSLLLTFKK
jgi:transposase